MSTVSETPIVKSMPAFADLVAPFDFGRFLESHWEQRPLQVVRNDAEYFESLLSFDDVDRVLNELDLRPEQLRLVDAGERIDGDEITTPEGRVDPQRVYRLFEAGATIVVSAAHVVLPRLARFVGRLEAEVTHRWHANFYMTPPNASGFAPHYDPHDVFVLQIAGTKNWRTYGTPIALPLAAQGWEEGDHETGEVSDSMSMSPGDTLYLPRGLMHNARSTDCVSLHVTLGIPGLTWTDFMLEAMAQTCHEDVEFRGLLPFSFARQDFDAQAARQTFGRLIERLRGSDAFATTLAALADDFVQRRHPMLRGQFESLQAVDELREDAIVERRPDVIYRFQTEGDQFMLSVYGVRIAFPERLEHLVRFALDTPSFRPRDLPGNLDSVGKLAVVRRLIREGLLTVRDGQC